MKYIYKLGLLLVLSFSTTVVCAALKIGVLNVETLLTESPQAKFSMQKLEKEFKGRQAELQSIDSQLKKAFTALQRDKEVISESERRKKEQNIQKLQRDLQRKDQEFKADYSARHNEELASFLKIVKTVADGLAVKEKYDLVLHDKTTFFHSKHIDITDKVLQGLKAASSSS